MISFLTPVYRYYSVQMIPKLGYLQKSDFISLGIKSPTTSFLHVIRSQVTNDRCLYGHLSHN